MVGFSTRSCRSTTEKAPRRVTAPNGAFTVPVWGVFPGRGLITDIRVVKDSAILRSYSGPSTTIAVSAGPFRRWSGPGHRGAEENGY